MKVRIEKKRLSRSATLPVGSKPEQHREMLGDAPRLGGRKQRRHGVVELLPRGLDASVSKIPQSCFSWNASAA